MKLHLPKTMLAVVLCSMTTGMAYAETDVVSDTTVVETTDGFLSAQTNTIYKDGSDKVTITDDVTKKNVYVREGELEIVAAADATAPTGKFSSVSVSGNNAKMTIVGAEYKLADGSLNHVGGVDGNGSLVVDNKAVLNGSSAELFTIGVQGHDGSKWIYGSAGTGFTGGTKSPAKNESANSFGRGDVSVMGESTVNLTSRHLQMGEGSLTVDNSTVIVGNKNAQSEYYKGFKATLGVGENTTSEITVTNGGAVEIYASQNGNTLGGFSTNYSDNSTAIITVDGGTFTVDDPVNSDSAKYPEGRSGQAYIGFSHNSDGDGSTPAGAKTVIDIKNGGEVNFKNHTTSFGYEGMADNGSSVEILVGQSSALNIVGKDFDMNEGTLLSNKGNITIDSHYANNRMANGEMAYSDNPADFKGGVIDNDTTGSITSVNGISFGDDSQSLKVDNKGSISAGDDIEIKGNTEFKNSGTLKSDDIALAGPVTMENTGTIEGYLTLNDLATLENSGSIEGTTWLNGSDAMLTALEGSTMQTVFLTEGTMVVAGELSMTGNLTEYYSSGTELVFTMDGRIDMNGNTISLKDTTLVLLVDFDITDGDTTTNFSFLHKDDLFENYSSESFSGETEIVLRDSEGHEAVRMVAAIPEPTTATLSLLALAGLAARRRRK